MESRLLMGITHICEGIENLGQWSPFNPYNTLLRKDERNVPEVSLTGERSLLSSIATSPFRTLSMACKCTHSMFPHRGFSHHWTGLLQNCCIRGCLPVGLSVGVCLRYMMPSREVAEQTHAFRMHARIDYNVKMPFSRPLPLIVMDVK